MPRRDVLLAVALFCATGVSAPTVADSSHFLPLFPPASHPDLAGFARIINHSDTAGTVYITGIDDEGTEYGPVELSLAARASAHFNSDDLEMGNPAKGLLDRLGDGKGDWRLRLESDLDIESLSYVRTGDGFVTAMHEVVPEEGMRHHVRFFNPGGNRDQVSRLRLINAAGESVEVTIAGLDDNGDPAPGGEVHLTLGSGEARTLTAQALESGDEEVLTGSLGDGHNKWQLFVSADGPIHVMSLLRSPTAHLSNLSAGGLRQADGMLEADPSIAEYLTGPVERSESPGLFAAIVDMEGVQAIGVAGVRRESSPRELTVNDSIRINSNTKAMTSTMLATLVADGTFNHGWQTTIADVFPELLGEIHGDYHSVSLRQLVTMTGGIVRNAANGYWNHQRHHVVENRYRILREELESPPVGPVGEFSYSNLGYMVAGAMAEKVTGKSWETLMEERLFTPLGMTAAGFRFQESPDYNDDQPWGHWREDGESWVPWWLWRPPAWGPAATVYLSIEDWAKFIGLWFLDNEPAILDRSTLNELISPDFGTATPYPDIYTAGWYVRSQDSAEGVVLSHGGSSCCWNTRLLVFPAQGVAFVAASNAWGRDTTGDLLRSITGSLMDHDPIRSAGLDPAAKDYVLAPDWDEIEITQHAPVERESRHRDDQ